MALNEAEEEGLDLWPSLISTSAGLGARAHLAWLAGRMTLKTDSPLPVGCRVHCYQVLPVHLNRSSL